MIVDPTSFNVSTTTGFLLESPLEYLPPYFQPWDETARSIVSLISENRLRQKIDQLPLLDVDRLIGHRQIRLAYLEVGALISGYIWCRGEEDVPRILPKALSVPFYKLSEKLGLQLGMGLHMAVVLTNYKLKDKSLPLRCDNMEIISNKVIEDYGNDWFHLITAQVELEFARAVVPLTDAIHSASIKDFQSLQVHLETIRNVIENMEARIGCMGDHLTMDVYSNQLRPYLYGTSGRKYDQWGGIILEGISEKPIRLAGGSAAQAASIQCLDALLQIEHDSKSRSFLVDMRQWMLPSHRQFIEQIEHTSHVREIVVANSMKHPNLMQMYQECVQALINFRNRHIQTVTKFVVIPKSRQNINKDETNINTHKSLDEIGTGGSGIMPFLKNVRDTTKNYLLDK